MVTKHSSDSCVSHENMFNFILFYRHFHKLLVERLFLFYSLDLITIIEQIGLI